MIAELLGTRIIMLSSGSAGARSQLLAEETEELLENSRHVAFYTGCMAGELDEISAFLREYASVRTAMEVIYPKRRKFSAENIHFVRVFGIFTAHPGRKSSIAADFWSR